MEELNALSALLRDFIQSSSRSWNERVQLRERVQAVLARGADDPMSRQPFARALAERVTDTSLLFRLLAEIQDFDEVDSASLVVRFPIDVAAAWWRLASPESRGELIASLTPNSHWAVVASALAEADATREDIEALCTASLRFDENEGRQSVANGVAAWAARAPGRATVILRRWMDRAVSPPLEVVSGLVRVAVKSVELPDVERSAIISRLLGSSSPEARVIGMKLECFAWPPSTPAETRHEAVLAHVRSAPRLGLEALQAFNDSAWSSPDDALCGELGSLLSQPCVVRKNEFKLRTKEPYDNGRKAIRPIGEFARAEELRLEAFWIQGLRGLEKELPPSLLPLRRRVIADA